MTDVLAQKLERAIDARKTVSLYWRTTLGGAWRAVATISQGGVTLPTWFLAVVTAAFLTAAGFAVKIEMGISDTVTSDHQAIQTDRQAAQRDEARIDRLESVIPDVAAMKSDIASTKATAEKTDAKVDRLIERQLERRRP